SGFSSTRCLSVWANRGSSSTIKMRNISGPSRNRLDSLPKVPAGESRVPNFAADDSERGTKRLNLHQSLDHGHAFSAQDHAIAIQAAGEMAAAGAGLAKGHGVAPPQPRRPIGDQHRMGRAS